MDVSSDCHYEISMGRMRLWASSFGLWLAAPGVSNHLIQPANFYRGMVCKIRRLEITAPATRSTLWPGQVGATNSGYGSYSRVTYSCKTHVMLSPSEPSIRHFIISFPRHCFVMIRYPPVPEAKTRIEFSGMRSSAFILEVKEQEQE